MVKLKTVGWHSLRARLLLPLVCVSLLTAGVIGIASSFAGTRSSRAQIDDRFQAITQTLEQASFPLTAPVLEMLSQLTGAEFVVFDDRDRLLATTLRDERSRLDFVQLLAGEVPENALADSGFLVRRVVRNVTSGRALEEKVLVLIDDRFLRQARYQAMNLPLVTGLLTMLVMSLVTWGIVQSLVKRIQAIGTTVDKIALGDFHAIVSETESDELSRLHHGVSRMGNELGRLWKTVHHQERQRLMQLIAAGLSHQLRNSLTGARMAVELHAQKYRAEHDPEIQVVLHELDRTEENVHRLVMAAADEDEQPTPGEVDQAISEIRRGLDIIARHQRLQLDWILPDAVRSTWVGDPKLLAIAVQNLVLNALQAGGDSVTVAATRKDDRLEFVVTDNGNGPPSSNDRDIFEAFVTTKPEGLGLGLVLVRRAAEKLAGSVAWTRVDSLTRFQLHVAIHPKPIDTDLPPGNSHG